MKPRKLHHDEKKSTKLSTNEISQIRRDFPKNPNFEIFAQNYGVTQKTIRYWVDENYRQKSIAESTLYHKIRSKSPAIRKLINEQYKESEKRKFENFPFVKEYRKEYYKEYCSRPEIKERRKQYDSRPEIKEHRKEYKKQYDSRPEIKERAKQYKKQYYSRPEIKEHRKQHCKEYYSRPEVKERAKQYYLRKKQGGVKND